MTKKNTMNNIALALLDGATIHNNKTALINADKVGAAEFIEWSQAMKNCYRTFYAFYKHTIDVSQGAELDPRVKTYAFNSLRDALNIIGEVNGFKVAMTDDLMTVLAETAVTPKKTLMGEALTVASEQKILKDQRKAMVDKDGQKKNGVNEELWTEINEKLEDATSLLSDLKKCSGSAKKTTVRAKYDNFRIKLETKFAEIIAKQSMKTWEELEEEEKQRKEDRARRQRERRAAKKAEENK